MKKKSKKKLKLQKEIISQLNLEDLEHINGGGVYKTENTCWCPQPKSNNCSMQYGATCGATAGAGTGG